METLESAKLLCGGSIPPQASIDMFKHIYKTAGTLFVLIALTRKFFPNALSSNEDILMTTITIIGTLIIISYGLDGIILKEISLRGAETHTGQSAVIWGSIFVALGIFIFFAFLAIQTDFLYSGKFIVDRLY